MLLYRPTLHIHILQNDAITLLYSLLYKQLGYVHLFINGNNANFYMVLMEQAEYKGNMMVKE